MLVLEFVLGLDLCFCTETGNEVPGTWPWLWPRGLSTCPWARTSILTDTWILFVTCHSVASTIFAENAPGRLPMMLVLGLILALVVCTC